jgi:hypothetical protein
LKRFEYSQGMSDLGGQFGRWFRNAQRMFHMLVGLVFLVLTLAGASVSVNLWDDYRSAPEQGLVSFELVSGFTVLLFILCLYTFAKARSVR